MKPPPRAPSPPRRPRDEDSRSSHHSRHRHEDERGRGHERGHERDRRESSASRERRRRERKEKRRERRESDRRDSSSSSLYPPGAELSHYEYNAATYWHVTPDQVWWYRPDLTLWYDCRSEAYCTYDASLQEYVSVEKVVATSALAEGRNVAPPPAVAAPTDTAPADGAQLASATATAAADDAPEASAGVGGGGAAGGDTLLCPALSSGGGVAPVSGASGHSNDDEDEGELKEEDGAMGGGAAAVSGEEHVAEQLEYHTESWQGKKETQEDRYIQGSRAGRLGTMFGVFDGHGGTNSAEYVAKHLPNNVSQLWQRAAASTYGALGRRDSFGGGDALSLLPETRRKLSCLEEAFPLTDRELMSYLRRKGAVDGTTALLVLISGDDRDRLTLLCSHVGDCRAVLCRSGAAHRLTRDHRPDRKDEQQRIRAAGGGVLQVAGIWRCTTAAGAARAKDARAGFDNESHTYLSCSRTLGDPELKMNADRPILSNAPDSSATPLEADDLFFVIACDGVWDVLTDQQVCDLVLEKWGDPAAAASAIVRTALSSGSGDNLTAQVVTFGWKRERGAAIAAQRLEEREQEKLRAAAPKEKVVVDEGDLDIFS